MIEAVENINFADAYIESDMLYAAGFDHNIFFQYNMDKNQLQILGGLKRFTVLKGFSVHAIFRYEDELYCFSENTYEVVGYHLKKEQFNYYYLGKRGDSVSIHSICRVGNKVWLFQDVFSSSVVVFSMDTKAYAIHHLDVEMIQSFDKSCQMAGETSINIGNEIWRCIPGNDVLVGLDIHNLNNKIVTLGTGIPFFTLSYDNGCIYALDENGKNIIVWNRETQAVTLWETGYNGSRKRPFRKIIKVKNKIFLLPCREEEIYCYEILENQLRFICTIKYPTEFKRVREGSLFYGATITNQNEIYLFPFGGNGLLCLNVDNLEIKYYSIRISEKDYIYSRMKSNSLLYEKLVNIGPILNLVETETIDNNSGYEMSIGKHCWKKLKN